MVYINEKLVPIKPLVNKWLYSMPQIIQEDLNDLESFCNWFLPKSFEYIKPENLIYPIT
jgi:hypothetical protein